MLTKIKKSLAYRLPLIYKRILRFKKIKSKSKLASDHVVLTMTGKNHIELTRLSILTIANKWSKLPKLIIYSDGSIDDSEIKNNLSFWKGELKIYSWSLVKDLHTNMGRKALLKYAEINPFGKKMALILYHAAQQPVIWIDSDILFFKDFTPYIPNQNLSLICGGSEDWLQAFDYQMIDLLKSDFDSNYKFNAGMLYVSGKEIYEEFKIENILKSVHPNYDFLTEQTIFAHIAKSSLGIIWKQNILKNSHEDNQNINATDINQIVARHYVSNVRHLFWRDAFKHFSYLNKPD